MQRSPCVSCRGACPRWFAFALVVPFAAAGCSNGFSPEALRERLGLGSTREQTPPRPPPEPLRLLAAGATEASVRDTMPLFEAKTGLSVTFDFGAVGALRDRVLAGEAADLLVVTPAIITTLEAQQRVHAGSRVDLGQVGGGIAVRRGDPLPAVDTPDALERALLDADEVYYADPAVATAGAALMKVVDTLGIGEQVRAKGHIAAGGKAAMQNMTLSSAPRVIGATQISEIKSVPAAVLVGGYPAPLQVETTYSALILERTTRAADASQLIQFFAGPEFQARLAQSGFEPVSH
jgi:molybdate transport system substrate-binding protein